MSAPEADPPTGALEGSVAAQPPPALGREELTVESLETRVGQLVERVAAVSEERGSMALAGSLRDDLARDDPGTTLVVAGETNRGKSSLINALLGMTVCPVDADVATNVHMVVRHSESPVPHARVYRDGSPDASEIQLEEVEAWATAAGNPLNSKRVRAVEIGLRHPLLARGLTVIDTPGVGGLDAAHRQVTLAALSRADAMVFVLDCSAPLSRPEYEFLADAAARMATVLLVLTKVDAYPGWEEILAENRNLLATHAARYAGAPMYPVSSVEKLEADFALDRELAANSGFPELEGAIVARVVGKVSALRTANLAQAARFALARLDEPEHATLAAGEGGRALVAEQAETRARSFAQQVEGFSQRLSIEFQRRVRQATTVELRRRQLAISAAYEGRIRSGEIDLEPLAADLDEEFRALASDIHMMVFAAAQDLADQLGHHFSVHGVDRAIEQLAQGVLEVELPPVEPQAWNWETGEMVHQARGIGTFITGAASGRFLAAMLPGGAIVGVAVGLAMGGLSWFGGEWMRKKMHGQQEAINLLRSAAETARVEIDSDLQARLLDLQEALQESLQARIKERQHELAAIYHRHKEAEEADAARRREQRTLAEARLAETSPLHALADRLNAEARRALDGEIAEAGGG